MPRRCASGAYTSSVSRAFCSCFCLPRYSIVRRLCRRSASLIRITRRSSAIATISFAVVLGLRVLAALELDAGQLRDALDELSRSRSPNSARTSSISTPVSSTTSWSERRRERRLVELQAGEDLGGAPWVVDELLARLPHLAVVRVAPRSGTRASAARGRRRACRPRPRRSARRQDPDGVPERPSIQCTPGLSGVPRNRSGGNPFCR